MMEMVGNVEMEPGPLAHRGLETQEVGNCTHKETSLPQKPHAVMDHLPWLREVLKDMMHGNRVKSPFRKPHDAGSPLTTGMP